MHVDPQGGVTLMKQRQNSNGFSFHLETGLNATQVSSYSSLKFLIRVHVDPTPVARGLFNILHRATASVLEVSLLN